MKTIFITGATSGIGKETAKYFSENNWKVIGTSRKKISAKELGFNENVTIYSDVDITSLKSIKVAREKAQKEFGFVDVVLNNAGFGMIGAIETCDEKEIRAQFETNVFGHVNVIKEFLPVMRENNKGHIINITSIGGKIAFPYFGYYNATKYSMEAISEALWYELKDTNIKVKVVEPGFTRTGFATTGMKEGSVNIPFYKEPIKKLRDRMVGNTKSGNGSDPIEVSKVIFKAANDDNKKLRYNAGSLSGTLLFAKKYFPDFAFMNLIKRQF